MRYLLTLLLALAATAAHASSEPITVQGRGATQEAARQQAYRLAVEQVAGTVILSETQAQNSKMARDEIITYASGYVDRSEVLETAQGSGWVWVNMRVWVKRTAVAGRLLHQQDPGQPIDGQRLASQIATHQHQAQTGDQLIRAIMNDYPARAFDVRSDPVRIVLDGARTAHLAVQVHTRWSQTYMQALDEALRAVNPNPGCATWFYNCRDSSPHVEMEWRALSRSGAWFNDWVTLDLIKRPLENTVVVYRMTLTMRGSAPKVYCFLPEWRGHRMFSIRNHRVQINGYDQARQTLSVSLAHFPVERLLETQVDMVPQSQCIYAP